MSEKKNPLKFYHPKEGTWVQPIFKGYLLSCCDCGLIHQMDFRIVYPKGKEAKLGRVQFRAFRARKLTAEYRKQERIRVTL